MEIFRKDLKKPTLFDNDNSIVALISNSEIPEAGIPRFTPSDIKGIADFIVNHCAL